MAPIQERGISKLSATSDKRWALDVIGKKPTDRTILGWNGDPRQQTQQPRNFAAQFGCRR